MMRCRPARYACMSWYSCCTSSTTPAPATTWQFHAKGGSTSTTPAPSRPSKCTATAPDSPMHWRPQARLELACEGRNDTCMQHSVWARCGVCIPPVGLGQTSEGLYCCISGEAGSMPAQYPYKECQQKTCLRWKRSCTHQKQRLQCALNKECLADLTAILLHERQQCC